MICELEFMYYLIHKEARAPDKEKALLCRGAAGKFFDEHLYPAGKKIAEKIIQHAKNNFYRERARELLEFLESER